MSRLDSAAISALDADYIRPKFYAFLDLANEPVRVNTSGADFTFQNTGDPDLDGHEFIGISGDLVDITPVEFRDGGSAPIAARLSGLIDLDNDLLNEIGGRENWHGRAVRLWRAIHDENDVRRGAVQPYYTGYMTDLTIIADVNEQIIELQIENYIAAFSAPSNRDYNQARFDPDDKSYAAAIAIANGTSGIPLTNNTPISGGISDIPNNITDRLNFGGWR